jgi:hypothetical protein
MARVFGNHVQNRPPLIRPEATFSLGLAKEWMANGPVGAALLCHPIICQGGQIKFVSNCLGWAMSCVWVGQVGRQA